MQTIPMTEVVALNEAKDGKWFDEDTTRYFDSKWGDEAWVGDDGRRFFVSSEQFRGGRGVELIAGGMFPNQSDASIQRVSRSFAKDHGVRDGDRRYTVRAQNPESGNISTIGDFQAFDNEAEAKDAAIEYAGDA